MRRSGPAVEGRALVAGIASGEALVLDEPLSFWGGVEPGSGTIVDVRHPQLGLSVRGRIVVVRSGRGSSSSSSVLAEAIRAGTAPAAIVLAEPDPILALGSLVARELYGTTMPIVVLEAQDFEAIRRGEHLEIDGASVSRVPS
jgi:predicted aconitase with swiveling domain